ncbi:MAG: flippase-like domain-containing protein [Deltaproteobacteria bacterium]|nr:flippase-like domain-containing protein [Deltaproteobacteria bacterium]
MNKKIGISLGLGLAVSILALYLAFRNVPFNDLIIYFASINYAWILPAVVVILSSFALRAYRWKIILESAGKIRFWQSFHPLMIGFMINCILPGRVGEVARPVILQKKENIPFSTGLATVGAERVFDVGILIILFAVLLATIEINPNLDIVFGKYHLNKTTLMTVGKGTFKLLLLLIAGIAMVAFNKTRNVIINLITRMPGMFFFAGPGFKKTIQKKIGKPLVSVVENFATGFTLVKYPMKICACLGLSVVIWGLAAFSYYLVSLGCPGIELSFIEMTASMVIICFFIALPSVPGYWGIWEAGGVFALLLFGVSPKDAAGFTLANHAIQIFPVIFVGLISAMATSVNILHISYKEREK